MDLCTSKLFLPVKITETFHLRFQAKGKQINCQPRRFPHTAPCFPQMPWARSAIWKGNIHRLQEGELRGALLTRQFTYRWLEWCLQPMQKQRTPPTWFISAWIWQELASPHPLEVSSLGWKIQAFALLSLLNSAMSRAANSYVHGVKCL